ncbi:DUF805 domain-containing protein [Bradyrhizobium commune]|uniref:DUF805 domain-containing protein n=1 Tax=Bradyrhizobium commune TaxID=83627 RepID=A0A7S9D775_9BRAD|nr:DUF805 domain-containing protein [Bradyrhizobium commune]QPF92496.1 DUF805 domain-containing protein [Bradyrhizobium commune]
MDWTWYLFRFDGRINRALLWQALLIVALLVSVLELVDQAVHVLNGQKTFKFSFEFDFDFGVSDVFRVVDPRAYRLLAAADHPTLILKVISVPLFLWIYLATAIKRLHDRDRSGWWMIPFFVVPNSVFQFWDLLPDANWFVPFELAIYALLLWGLVEMFIAPGTSGSNRFGPDPLAKIEDSSASAPSPAKSWDQQSEIEFVPPSASPPGGMHVKRGA